MKPIDVKSSTYIDFDVEYNIKNPKYEIGNHIAISKHKIFLQMAKLEICLNKFSWLKKLEDTVMYNVINH